MFDKGVEASIFWILRFVPMYSILRINIIGTALRMTNWNFYPSISSAAVELSQRCLSYY